MDIRNDALGSMPVSFLSKQGVLDIVSGEYDVAIQSEGKFGSPRPSAWIAGKPIGWPSEPPITSTAASVKPKARTRSTICRG